MIVHPIPKTHVVRCMHVHIYLWRWDWHHWWPWGGGQLHCPRLVPGVVGVPQEGPSKMTHTSLGPRATWSKTLSTSSCGQPRLGGTRQCKGLSCKGRPFTECAGCSHLAQNSLIFMQHNGELATYMWCSP